MTTPPTGPPEDLAQPIFPASQCFSTSLNHSLGHTAD